jgi:hypothetical protein
LPFYMTLACKAVQCSKSSGRVIWASGTYFACANRSSEAVAARTTINGSLLWPMQGSQRHRPPVKTRTGRFDESFAASKLGRGLHFAHKLLLALSKFLAKSLKVHVALTALRENLVLLFLYVVLYIFA